LAVSPYARKPTWLHKKIRPGHEANELRRLLRGLQLTTVCEEAACPNLNECWGRGTATFILLGSVCTRRCHYCNVPTGRGLPPDPDEPDKVAEAARDMGLRHVVVTSVARDDLRDGGAGHFARTILALRRELPRATVEVLIPDFKGREEDLRQVMGARPDVLNHNIETVRRVFPRVRPQGNFDRSLELLRRVRAMDPDVIVKSGFMVGLGETNDEVRDLLGELRKVGVQAVTIGQYLRPTFDHAPVDRYVTPGEFETFRGWAKVMGFAYVAAGPFVRSSFNAAEAMATMAGSGGKTGPGQDGCHSRHQG